MENFSHEHQCYYIFVSWKNGKDAKQIHTELQVAEGPKALSLRSIYRWIESFESGDENIEDDSHSGHPNEIVTPKNVAEIEDLIIEDPHIHYPEKSIWTPIYVNSILPLNKAYLNFLKILQIILLIIT